MKAPTPSPRFSVLIPSWDGKELLQCNLPYVLEECADVEEGVEVIVGDDGSSDGTKDWISKEYPSISCIRSCTNDGFSSIVNRMVRHARGDLIYLLNNDARPEKGFLSCLVPHFDDERVFAVGSMTTEDAEGSRMSYPRMRPLLGLHYYRYDRVPLPLRGGVPVCYISGGHSCFRLEMFLHLGGFDERLGPFYLEDQDLCLRARSRNWKILMEPESRVAHAGQGTIGKRFNRNRVLAIHWRNRFVLSRSHYHRWQDRLGRIFSVPAVLGLAFIRRQPYVALGFLQSRSRSWWKSEGPKWGGVKPFFPKMSKLLRWPKKEPVHVLVVHQHAIVGGAERSLASWILQMPRPYVPIAVLGEEGPMAESLRKNGIEVWTLPFPPLKPTRCVDIARCIFTLVRIAKEKRAALIHSNTPRTNLVAGLAGKWANVPVLWHARNLIYGEMKDTDRLFMSIPAKIICNSRAIERRFHRDGVCPAHVETVYSGVDTRLFNPQVEGSRFRQEVGLKPRQVAIGIVGRIGVGKGHDVFVQAARRARDMGSRAKYCIVGGAQEAEERRIESDLHALVRKLRLEDYVSFTGMMTNMPEVMAGLDVVTLCTVAEPFARILLEAMASGRPVVGTSSGGTPEIIEEGVTGRLFPPGDAEALVKIFLELEADTEERQRLGRNAREVCEARFGIERHVARMSRLYWESITGY